MKQTHQLHGQIGTDTNCIHATHTGNSKANAKASDAHPELKLTPEEQDILDGKSGDLLQKTMKTVCDYGRLFGADKLVDLKRKHPVTHTETEEGKNRIE